MLTVFLQIVYGLVVAAIAVGSVYFLDAEDLPIITASLAAKTLTFGIAAVSIILVEIVYAWRMHIDPVAAFNKIERSGRNVAIFLGLFSLGLCILAGNVYG